MFKRSFNEIQVFTPCFSRNVNDLVQCLGLVDRNAIGM